MSYTPSKRLTDYLESIETLVSPARQLPADRPGVITGGFGETNKSRVHSGMFVPTTLARAWMFADLVGIQASIEHKFGGYHGVDFNDGEYDALLSFTYNEGIGELSEQSSITKNIRYGNWQAAGDAFLLYDKAAGRILHGLDTRRALERSWFLS